MGYSPRGRKESDMTERYVGVWVWVYLINNVEIVSGDEKGTQPHMHVSILPQSELAFFHFSAQAVFAS